MPDEDLIQGFITALDSGELDDILPTIIDYIENRREILRDQLRKKVKDLFGEDADITTAKQAPEIITTPEVKAQYAAQNPFIQKAQENSEGGPQTPPGLPADPMGDLDSLDAQMSSEAEGDPFAMRGAIISGIHSSQIYGG
jgi:hypothetical protein